MEENGVTKGYLSLSSAGLVTIRLTEDFLESGSSNIAGNMHLKVSLDENSAAGGDEVLVRFPGHPMML